MNKMKFSRVNGRIWSPIAIWSLAFASSFPISARAQDWRPIMDKLTEKGIFSKEDRDEIDKEMEAAGAEKASPAALPFSLKVGGRVQLRFAAQQNDPNGKDKEDSFRIRRARISMDGTLIEDVDFHVEADVSREAALEEAEIRLLYFPWAAATLGQFKTPFSMGNLTSAKKLDTAERAEAVTALSPDKEIGLMVGGKFFDKRLSYRASLTNGNGKNKKANDNDQFLYVLRLEGVPVREGHLFGRNFSASIGANAALSHDSAVRAEEIFGVSKALGSASEGKRRLAGCDLSLRWGKSSFKAEYLYGNFKPSRRGLRQINAGGYYVQGGHYLTPDIQAIIRHEDYDPDRHVSDNSDLRWTTLGANYFIREHDLKFQANCIFKGEDGISVKNDTLFVMIQLLI